MVDPISIAIITWVWGTIGWIMVQYIGTSLRVDDLQSLRIFNTVVPPHKHRIKICYKIGQGCQNLPLLKRLFILKSKNLDFDIVGSHEALK